MNAFIMGTGKMGHAIEEALKAQGSKAIAMADSLNPAPFEEAAEAPEVVIDFSHRNNLPLSLELAAKYDIPLILGTTGLNEEDQNTIEEASKSIPIFFASNYSLGIAMLTKLAEQAAKVLGGKWDMEIVETHHNQKKDAPSGTALSLAKAIDPDDRFKKVYGRQGYAPREKDEIGIHAVRGGTVAGEHSVFFFGDNEQVELRHLANNRSIFANGAVNAADFMVNENKKAGLYDMNDLLKAVLEA